MDQRLQNPDPPIGDGADRPQENASQSSGVHAATATSGRLPSGPALWATGLIVLAILAAYANSFTMPTWPWPGNKRNDR